MNTLLTKENLEKMYLKENKSVKQISKEINLSYSYIQNIIKKFKIKRKRQYKNLVGQKFGKLTVIKIDEEKINNKRRQAYWIAKCECGKEKSVNANSLKCGDTKSCGCIFFKRFGQISGEHFGMIKYQAKARNLKFDINIEQLWNLFLKQNKKCKLTGIPLVFDLKNKANTTASLDRIDSTRGYTLDNIQWVHKTVNVMKMNMSDEELFKWAKLITNHKKH